MKKRVMLAAVLALAMVTLGQAAPWYQETYEPPGYSPTGANVGGNQLHNNNTGVNWVRALGTGFGDAFNSTMGPGGSASIFTEDALHTLVADPTKSHAGLQQITMDVRLTTIGATGMNLYVGEVRTSGTNGTSDDLDTYVYTKLLPDGAGGWKVLASGNEVATGLDVWRHDGGAEAWYQIKWDFDVTNDTVQVTVVDDVAGVLGSIAGTMANQNTPTFDAVNGLVVSANSIGLLWDNLTFTPEPATVSVLALGGLGLLRRRR